MRLLQKFLISSLFNRHLYLKDTTRLLDSHYAGSLKCEFPAYLLYNQTAYKYLK